MKDSLPRDISNLNNSITPFVFENSEAHSPLIGREPPTLCTRLLCCELGHSFAYMLAATVWICGFLATCDDGVSHLQDSYLKGASNDEILATLVTCIGLGLFLGWYGFVRLANRNIDRIIKLESPKWHEAFRWQLWLILIVFDGGTFVIFSYTAQGSSALDMNLQLLYTAIDLCVSTCLFVSFFVFPYRWVQFRKDVTTKLNDALLYRGSASLTRNGNGSEIGNGNGTERV